MPAHKITLAEVKVAALKAFTERSLVAQSGHNDLKYRSGSYRDPIGTVLPDDVLTAIEAHEEKIGPCTVLELQQDGFLECGSDLPALMAIQEAHDCWVSAVAARKPKWAKELEQLLREGAA